MKSISSKIIVTNILFLFTFILCVMTFVYYILKTKVTERSYYTLDAAVARQVLRIDTELSSIEESVQNMHDLAFEFFDETLLKDEKSRQEYTNKIKNLIKIIAANTKSISSAYFRFDNEIDSNEGFYIAKKSKDFISKDDFIDVELSDFSEFSPNDERMAWFYKPKQSKKAEWLNPYFSDTFGKNVISFTMPITVDGKFIGVLGIETDFDAYVQIANKTKIYSKPKIFIFDLNSQNLYKNNNDKIEVQNINQNLLKELLKDFTANKNEEILKLNNEEYFVSFGTTKNNMKFIIQVAKNDALFILYDMFYTIILLSFIAFVILAFLSYKISRKITYSLEQLTSTAKQIAKGNFAVCPISNTKDEIGILSRTMCTMAETIKQNMQKINELAYKDDLTKVGNKTAYTNYIENFNEPNYAVIVFDVNNLKHLNDNYGHKQGDALIKMASSHICKSFAHSPVFRIGGDEFVAILKGQDYENKEKLLEFFSKHMSDYKLEITPFCELSIAFGIAQAATNYDETFALADKNMYAKKQEMKAK